MTNEEILIKEYGNDIEGEFASEDIVAMNRIMDAARQDEAEKYKQLLERASSLVGNPGCNISMVTGTFHGSWIEAKTEGEARRIFHKKYKGESIIHIVKRYWVYILG